MKPNLRALSVALFVTLASCGAGVDPVGVWSIDPDATLVANQVLINSQLASIPQADRPKAKEKLEDDLKSMQGTMDFNADETLVSSILVAGEKQVRHGTWEVDGDKMTMRLRAAGSEVDDVYTGPIDSVSMTVIAAGTDYFLALKRN